MSVATGLPLHREGLIAPASEEDTSERTNAGENFVKSVQNPTNSEEVASSTDTVKNGKVITNGNEESDNPNEQAKESAKMEEDFPTNPVDSPEPKTAELTDSDVKVEKDKEKHEEPKAVEEDTTLYYKTIVSQKKMPGESMRIAVRDPPSVEPPADKKTRSTNQLEYLKKIVNKNLWPNKQAWPFLKPVDAIALELPTYYELIKEPMDLGTIRKRLNGNYYFSAEEVIHDIRLMFNNCFIFNPPTDDVAKMGMQLKEIFEKKLRDMPGEEHEIVKSSGSKSAHRPSALKQTQSQPVISAPVPVSSSSNVGEGSGASPIADSRSSTPLAGQNQPPSPSASVSSKGPPLVQRSVSLAGDATTAPSAMDLSETPVAESTPDLSNTATTTVTPAAPSSSIPPRSTVISSQSRATLASARKKRRPSTLPAHRPGSTASQDPMATKRLELCSQVLEEMFDARHREYAQPFYRPVDTALEPEYPKVVRRPMDLTTIKRKLENNQYTTTHDFVYDVRLMFTNCYRYNPPGHIVAELGHKLQAVFETQIALLLVNMLEDEADEGKTSMGASSTSAKASTSSASIKKGDKGKDHEATPRKHAKDGKKDDYDSGAKKARVSHSPTKSKTKNRNQSGASGSEATPVPPTSTASADTSAFAMLQLQVSMLQQQLVTLSAQKSAPPTTPLLQMPDSTAAGMNATSPVAKKAPRKKREPKEGGAGRGRGQTPKSPAGSGRKAGRPSGQASSGQLPGWKTANSDKVEAVSPNAGYEGDADPDAGVRPMSYDEKRQLSQDINRLPPDNLAQVVEIVTQHETAFGNRESGANDEIEIDFEALRPKTLRELEKFVHSVLSGSSKRPAASKLPASSAATSTTASKPVESTARPSQPPVKTVPAPGKPRAPTAKRLSESSSDSSTSDSDSSEDGGDSSSNGSASRQAKKMASLSAKKPVPPPSRPLDSSKTAPAAGAVKKLIDSAKKPTASGHSPVTGWSAPTAPRPAPPIATAGLPPQLTSNANPDSFDAFKKRAAEKEERERLRDSERPTTTAQPGTALGSKVPPPRIGNPPQLHDESSSSGSSASSGGPTGPPAVQKSSESAIDKRERLKEEERKKRLAMAGTVDLTSKHELMGKFESADWAQQRR